MKNPDKCTHTHTKGGYWKPTNQYHGATNSDDEDWFDDEWIPEYDHPSTIDINIHQYKCTQCGKIFNY